MDGFGVIFYYALYAELPMIYHSLLSLHRFSISEILARLSNHNVEDIIVGDFPEQ